MNVNASGRRWARAGLTIGMGLSIGGNFVHSLLAESVITPLLRAWPAIFLPVIAFVSIEILIRIEWERKTSWQFARILIIAPLVGAGVSSFEHLRSLLLIMGERDFTAWWIPGAIDGLIVGATVVLIVTRPRPLSPPLLDPSLPEPALSLPASAREETLSEPASPISDEEAEEIMRRWHEELFPEGTETEETLPRWALEDWRNWGKRDLSEEVAESAESTEISLRRVDEIIPEPLPVPTRPASSRTSTDALAQGMAAVEYLLAGRKPAEIAVTTGAGQSTVYRWSATLRTLWSNVDAEVKGVNADLVDYMRDRVREIGETR